MVQTSGYGKFLGYLKVKFDREGELVNFAGNPILLDQTIPQDQEVEAMVSAYRARVAEKMEVVVGNTEEFIDGGRPKCRLEECSFGNLITDAMAEEMQVGIAIINSGSIKGSFEKGERFISRVNERVLRTKLAAEALDQEVSSQGGVLVQVSIVFDLNLACCRPYLLDVAALKPLLQPQGMHVGSQALKTCFPGKEPKQAK